MSLFALIRRPFESIAKTNTTHTPLIIVLEGVSFESIAKTNTTHTGLIAIVQSSLFESIAKTNTTHTTELLEYNVACLRVLLKQIQHTHF